MSAWAVHDAKLHGFVTPARATRDEAMRDKADLGHLSRYTVRRVPNRTLHPSVTTRP